MRRARLHYCPQAEPPDQILHVATSNHLWPLGLADRKAAKRQSSCHFFGQIARKHRLSVFAKQGVASHHSPSSHCASLGRAESSRESAKPSQPSCRKIPCGFDHRPFDSAEARKLGPSSFLPLGFLLGLIHFCVHRYHKFVLLGSQ